MTGELTRLQNVAFRLSVHDGFQDALHRYAHGNGSSAEIMRQALIAIKEAGLAEDEERWIALRRAIYGESE